MSLGLQAGENLLRVARARRIDAIAVQHLQRVEHSDGVFGPGAASERLQRIADQLPAVELGDQHRERRIFRRDLAELVVQRQPGDDVDDVAKVDSLLWSQPRLVSQGNALGPLLQGLRLALIGDLIGGHLLFLQPLAHVAQGVLGLVQIDRLRSAAGGRSQILRSGERMTSDA